MSDVTIVNQWEEPKSNHVASDEVTPAIFNRLAKNEKHLKEIICNIVQVKKDNTATIINNIVLVEV
ncbi:MAG: hypothetical protein IJ371_04200 [Clostridia bacterium]|nr:hypothetical protein [Clostridia bacterium]